MDDRVIAEGVNTPQVTRTFTRLTAVLIIVASSAVLVLVQRPHLVSERARAEAVAISEEFIEHLGVWDHQSASSLVAKAAKISITPIRSPADLEMGLMWMAATGWVFTSQGCAPPPATQDGVHRVLCHLSHESAWSHALKLDPDTRSALSIRVSSSQITHAFLSFAPISFHNEAVMTFDSWLGANHPEHVDDMYLYAGLPLLTPESIELWRQYTDEFVAAPSTESGDWPCVGPPQCGKASMSAVTGLSAGQTVEVVVSGLSAGDGGHLAGVLYEGVPADLDGEAVGGFWSLITDSEPVSEVVRKPAHFRDGTFPFVASEAAITENGTYTLVLWVDTWLSPVSRWVPLNSDGTGLRGCHVVFEVADTEQTSVRVSPTFQADDWNIDCTTGKAISETNTSSIGP